MPAEPVTVSRVIDKADDLQTSVAELTIDATAEEVAAVCDQLTAYIERGKQIKQQLDALMLDWIVLHERPIVIGPVRYIATVSSTVKCRNVPAAMEALMEASGGDWTLVCDCLSSNAIKYGAARKVLAERYDEFFERVEKNALKREGPKEEKPLPRADGLELVKIDERFTEGKH